MPPTMEGARRVCSRNPELLPLVPPLPPLGKRMACTKPATSTPPGPSAVHAETSAQPPGVKADAQPSRSPAVVLRLSFALPM